MHWYKICIFFLKYLPAVTLLILVVHVGMLLIGVTEGYTEFICTYGFFSMCLQLAASCALQFCLIHRVVIVYNYLVSACINYQRVEGFGCALFPCRLAVFVIGIVLLILFVRLWRCKKS